MEAKVLQVERIAKCERTACVQWMVDILVDSMQCTQGGETAMEIESGSSRS